MVENTPSGNKKYKKKKITFYIEKQKPSHEM